VPHGAGVVLVVVGAEVVVLVVVGAAVVVEVVVGGAVVGAGVVRLLATHSPFEQVWSGPQQRRLQQFSVQQSTLLRQVEPWYLQCLGGGFASTSWVLVPPATAAAIRPPRARSTARREVPLPSVLANSSNSRSDIPFLPCR
jgi:hypothetical protein